MATKTRPSRREADRTRPAKSSYLMTWEELLSYTGRLGNIHVSEVGSAQGVVARCCEACSRSVWTVQRTPACKQPRRSATGL